MRIKKYYCPHCGQFRSRRQVYSLEFILITKPIIEIECLYCDRQVIETEPEFKKFLDSLQKEKK